MSPEPGLLIVFAAPSGAGKTTIIRSLMKRMEGLRFSISSTTRPMRIGERQAIDYDFLSDEEFDRALVDEEFLEWEKVHLHRYGTRRSRVEPLLLQGYDVVFDLDVLGALAIKRLFPDALLIFIDAPSPEAQRERLLLRGREDEQEIETRIARSEMEREKASQFDVRVVNDDLQQTVDQIEKAIETYRAQRSGGAEAPPQQD